jgi:hypothetical protein
VILKDRCWWSARDIAHEHTRACHQSAQTEQVSRAAALSPLRIRNKILSVV